MLNSTVPAAAPGLPNSRRGFLCGLSVVSMAGSLALSGASAAEPDPADKAFAHWLISVGAYNSGRDPNCDDGDEGEAAWNAMVVEPEDAVLGLQPSGMAAAAIALLELSYEASFADDDVPSADTLLIRILACLLPSLTGTVATVGADLLARVGQPSRDALLWRGVVGELAGGWA